MAKKRSLSDSLEHYLKAIHYLVVKNRVARAKDIAEHLGVSKSSVTGALQSLSRRGLVNYDPYRFITLTEEGKEKAREIVHRHQTLKMFFRKVLKLSDEKLVFGQKRSG